MIEWSAVEGACSYNLYANCKLQTNTTKTEINLKSLKWDTNYSYYSFSLSDTADQNEKILIKIIEYEKSDK